MSMSISLKPPTAPRRVKVYELCKEEWTDKGTGLCSGEVVNDQAYVIVRNEENSSEILLEKHITGEIQFHKQQETLIVWSEADKNDMALSFQEADGCSLVCEYLVRIQRYVAKNISVTVVTTTEEGDYSELIAGPLNYPPTPTLGNLYEVVESFSQLMSIQFARESICAFLTETDYVHQLVEVFNKAEELESLGDLHNICRIMKLIFSLNDSKVLQNLIEDQNVVGVLGALEYDPAFPTLKANHREYYACDDEFKEVVPILDQEIRFNIKQTYRLQFFKDVLARLLDDSTLSVFTSLIFFNQISIVLGLQSSTDYMTRLFAIYKASPRNIEQQRDGVHFVHQISLATKGFQNQQKKLTFTKLISSGLFSLIEFALNDTLESIRMLGTELLLTIIDIDASLIRNYSQNSQAHSTFALMQTLVDLFFRENDIGLKSQAIEALKYMLDTMTNSLLGSMDDSTLLARRTSQELENDVFVASFYTNCGGKLFSSLADLAENVGRDVNLHMSLSDKALYEQLCDLLNFCVRTHGAKCRDFSMEYGLWKGISKLISCPHQSIQLAAIRCWKRALILEDETYMNHFAINELAESVVDVLVRMGNKNNLVNSACLEIMEMIEMGMSEPSDADKMAIIVQHLVASRRTELEQQLKFTNQASKILELYDHYLDDERTLKTSSKFRTISSSAEQTVNDTSPIMGPETPERLNNFDSFELDEASNYSSSNESKDVGSLVPYLDSDEEEEEETDNKATGVEEQEKNEVNQGQKRERDHDGIGDYYNRESRTSDTEETGGYGSPPPALRVRTESLPLTKDPSTIITSNQVDSSNSMTNDNNDLTEIDTTKQQESNLERADERRRIETA